jgi:hypothetical protein
MTGFLWLAEDVRVDRIFYNAKARDISAVYGHTFNQDQLHLWDSWISYYASAVGCFWPFFTVKYQQGCFPMQLLPYNEASCHLLNRLTDSSALVSSRNDISTPKSRLQRLIKKI